jgi:hypothetical protein
MGESITRMPQLNTPQNAPFAKVQKERHKQTMLQPIHIKSLEHDSTSIFDENEDQLRKKLQIGQVNPTPHFGIPQLLSPSNIIAGKDPSKVKGLDEVNNSPLRYVDSDLEKLTFQAYASQRTVYNESVNIHYQTLVKAQGFQRLLNDKKDDLMKELEERASKSDLLGWLQVAATVAWLTAASFCMAAAVVISGGLAAIGAVSAIAGGAKGIVEVINGFHQLGTKETEGQFLENNLLSQQQHEKMANLLTANQLTINKIYLHDSDLATILKNQSEVKIFN